MTFTIKEIAKLAGVTTRTLRYYDEIGLLSPAKMGSNGYRYYDQDSLLRLQQILFYRELDVPLKEIQKIVSSADFNPLDALEKHRMSLIGQVNRLGKLIDTIDQTIAMIKGEVNMSEKEYFKGFDEAKYTAEAEERWGGTSEYAESQKRWGSYTQEKKDQIMQESGAIYQELSKNMDKSPDSPEVRALLVRWHQNMRYFYEPSIEVLGGLGNMYHDDPKFNATFTKIHPDLPTFLKKSIAIYVDELETEWLEKELGILEE